MPIPATLMHLPPTLNLLPAGFSEEERSRIEEGRRNSGGNRWPRHETLALLKIRSDVDVAFRDSSLKGPLWDEVSMYINSIQFPLFNFPSSILFGDL